MRYLLMIAALAAGSLAAQPFFNPPAPGFRHTELPLPVAPPASYLVHGGAAWDPTGADLYYWDVANGAVRRYDMTLVSPAATELLVVPPGPFGFTYVDSLAFDPNDPNDLYIGESGNMVLHKVHRTGLDTIDPTFGAGGIQTSAPYSFFLFDMKFDPFGRLLGSGANSFGTVESGVYVFDKSTLTARQVIDLLTPGGTDISGPIAFDSAGNLYYGAPPAFTGNPMRVLRWSKAALDSAINSGGAVVLGASDATLVIDWLDNFPASSGMGFRVENGREVLYFAGVDGGLYRSDLATRAYTRFAGPALQPAGEEAFPSVVAIESPNSDFRPYSGDATRIAVVMGARDAMFDQTRHALCVFSCTDAPVGVDQLHVSGLPGQLSNGSAFSAIVELRDANGAAVTVEGAVQVVVHSGAGQLSGRTLVIATAGVARFEELAIHGAGGSVILRFEVVGTTTAANTGAIHVVGATGDSDQSDSDGGGCAAGTSAAWPLLALILWRRRPRA